MDKLRSFFPLAFQPKSGFIALVVNIIIHLLVDALAGVLIGILGGLPVVGGIISALSGLVGLYFTISLVLSVLHYLKLLK